VARSSPTSSALKPLTTIRQRRATVRPISQVLLTLRSPKDIDGFAATRKACLQWLSYRAGRPLPQGAWAGATFELEDVGAQRVGAVGIDSPKYWAARLDDADKNVAQRTWVTEIGIGQKDGGPLLFGTRLTCVVRGEDAPFVRSIPGFVRSIVESGGATLDGRSIGRDPWVVKSQKDVDRLVDLLLNPSRESDVIVFALPENSTNPRDTAAPARDVHDSTLGAAHVVILTGPASFHLSDRVGKEFSVFRQGVRTYLPGFNPSQDEPFRHPLGLPERIAVWPEGGPLGYSKMLASYALGRSVARPDREQRLPSYASIRRFAAQQALERAKDAGSSENELLRLAMDEIAQLQKAIDDQKKQDDELLETAEAERQEAIQAAQQASARADALRRRVEALEARLEEIGQEPSEIPIPESLDDLQAWAEKYLTGIVELHNRAFQGIKRSQYQDESFLYQALLLLRNYHVPMRRNPSDEAKRAYEEECKRLGLEESGTISKERVGEQGETYLVKYAGKKRLLDRHLKKGASKDQRNCFRLYFFWDDDSEQAVVGWLPSHLDTRET
jgi:hypothetical protein